MYYLVKSMPELHQHAGSMHRCVGLMYIIDAPYSIIMVTIIVTNYYCVCGTARGEFRERKIMHFKTFTWCAWSWCCFECVKK